MRPFLIPDAITVEAWKALVLQLDRGDDEAERAIRMSLERRTTRNLHSVFQDMLDTLYPQGYGEFENPEMEAMRVHQLFMQEQRLYDEISRALQDGVDLGVSVAVTGLEQIGYGFDWTLANVHAREWALRHTGELIRDLSATTERAVRQATARFIDNGEPLEALKRDLEPYFGRKRAERIAITEVTTAYQQGSEDAWRASEVVSEMEWVTVNDELVCPQCGPMQGERAPLGGTFPGGIAAPPRHINCRCFTRPVVREPNDR
jgi:SPP1 gp7 family putative phage head morphogenesis protein